MVTDKYKRAVISKKKPCDLWDQWQYRQRRAWRNSFSHTKSSLHWLQTPKGLFSHGAAQTFMYNQQSEQSWQYKCSQYSKNNSILQQSIVLPGPFASRKNKKKIMNIFLIFQPMPWKLAVLSRFNITSIFNLFSSINSFTNLVDLFNVIYWSLLICILQQTNIYSATWSGTVGVKVIQL